MTRFTNGKKDFAVGNHPLWELSRALYQMTKRPYVIGGVMLVSGYVSAKVRGAKRPVSPELVAFQRKEQMQRLRKFFGGSKLKSEETVKHPATSA